MRRARVGIRPNLGPKGPAPLTSQPTLDRKTKPATAVTPLAKMGHDHDLKLDHAGTAHLNRKKSSDAKVADHPSPGPLLDSVRSPQPTSESSQGNHYVQPAKSRSQRKSSVSEQAQIGSPRRKSQGADSLPGVEVGSAGEPRVETLISPGCQRSERKSSGFGLDPVGLAGPDSAGSPTGLQTLVCASSPTKRFFGFPAHVASPAKIAIKHRFAKVRPNLASGAKKNDTSVETAAGKSALLEPSDRDKDKTKLAAPKSHSTLQAANVGSGHTSNETAVEDSAELESTNTALQLPLSPICRPPPLSASLPSQTPAAAANAEATTPSSECDSSQSSTSVILDEGEATPSEAPSSPLATTGTALTTEQHKKVQEKAKKRRKTKPVLPPSDAIPDRTKMKMSDFIYWNSSRNQMVRTEKDPALSASSAALDATDSAVNDEEASNASSESLPVPQLKIGPDGNIILSTDSLVMENKVDEEPKEMIEEDDFRRYRGSNNNKRPARWSDNETSRFFSALSLVGTDFSLMCKLFPSRSRRELKNKFSKEEKKNRPLIDKALHERQGFNKVSFQKAVDEDQLEKDRLDKLAEEKNNKKTKQRKPKKKVDDDDEKESVADEAEEDGGEEDDNMEADMEEQEERKENNRKRRIALSKTEVEVPEEGETTLIKKSRRGRPRKVQPKMEVADILVSMSQTNGSGFHQDSEEESLCSVASSHNDSVFVPRAARPINVLQSPSGGVLIDSVPDLTLPASPVLTRNNSAIGASLPARASALQSSSAAYEPYARRQPTPLAARKPGADAEPRLSTSRLASPASTVQSVMASPLSRESVASPVMDIQALVDSLQAQVTTPVDVVLLEQHGGEEQGLVHVYLVPRIAADGAGGEGSSGANRSNMGFELMIPPPGASPRQGSKPSQQHRVASPAAVRSLLSNAVNPPQRMFSPPRETESVHQRKNSPHPGSTTPLHSAGASQEFNFQQHNTTSNVTRPFSPLESVATAHQGLMSALHGIRSPSLRSPPQGITSPPHGVMSPLHGIKSPPHDVSYFPRDVQSPPQHISSPPQQILSALPSEFGMHLVNVSHEVIVDSATESCQISVSPLQDTGTANTQQGRVMSPCSQQVVHSGSPASSPFSVIKTEGGVTQTPCPQLAVVTLMSPKDENGI